MFLGCGQSFLKVNTSENTAKFTILGSFCSVMYIFGTIMMLIQQRNVNKTFLFFLLCYEHLNVKVTKLIFSGNIDSLMPLHLYKQ